jgi:hypothetical protein
VGSPVFSVAEPRHECDGARPSGGSRWEWAVRDCDVGRVDRPTIVGGLLLGAVPSVVLIPLLVLLLLFSAVKVWRHD